ncbi:Starch-binding associating with outer membrane [Chitinophaga costaii]|uniref:Starch-binding associating with outer membrane n=1 Tax=Chitinophaga costaii TaxID=1335309 RepID=A0A1C4DTV1_9BACT|nr:RagB/SusD family nutrient uptake outer membrane protein [Chitinophaga costaii]PUZ27791.1 RagB/SusD family nutrient uptake outer membrane protein [Chitinophaga costaii]SCC34824.1 Starch-binding associating with outer membrane [Chitinophaga costaii]
MKKLAYMLLAGTVLWQACKSDADFLQRPPSNILEEDQVWQHSDLILSVLADLYDRYPDYNTNGNSTVSPSLENWSEFAQFDEAFASEAGQYGRHKWQNLDYNYPGQITSHDHFSTYWDYTYIRDLNQFIANDSSALAIPAADRTRYMAEARFLRAAAYFEEVKRVGGVPIITNVLTYDYSGDPSYLQHPRNKESEVYDFVLNELEGIKDSLPANADDKSRASKGAVLAMESRAALYAASIAKYGSTKPATLLPGGETGIPASMATAYYTKALKAAQELIAMNVYALYTKKSDNLADNFASVFYDKSSPETIFAKDYKLKSGKVEGWTLANSPRTSQEEQQGSRLDPSLNLVAIFEKLDNTFAPPAITNSDGSPKLYDNPMDLFADRDARLQGTVIIPGASFKGFTTDIFAGLQTPAGKVYSGADFGQIITLAEDGKPHQVVGVDGPIDNKELGTQTGFLIRKYMDPSIGSGRIGTQSEVWWIRFRYAEVLLNAAEAAFELGDAATAAGYLNQVRRRAGFTTDLLPAQITFDRIVHERKVELAFEGHEFYDMKRWRIADIAWNGLRMTAADVVSNLDKATRINTMVWALWPYKVLNPGGATDGKWLFKIVLPSNVTEAHRFQLGNYYSAIAQDIINNNPKIIKNPNQ